MSLCVPTTLVLLQEENQLTKSVYIFLFSKKRFSMLKNWS